MKENRPRCVVLEALVRKGSPEAVTKYAELRKFDNLAKRDSVVEAGVYSALNLMWEQADVGIDAGEIGRFLSQKQFADYFSKTNNAQLLEEIVDVLKAGTEASMEAYAQITAVDILGIEPLAAAIRRNINARRMKEKVTDLVEAGYSLVFYPHNIDAEMVKYYFPIINKWKDFVDPEKVVKEAIERFGEEQGELINQDHKRDFLYASFDKFVELTGKNTVSVLAHKKLLPDVCSKLVENHKINTYTSVPRRNRGEVAHHGVSSDVEEAIAKYSQDSFVSGRRTGELAKKIGTRGKKFMAVMMGSWFNSGKMEHLLAVANYKDGMLYDEEFARRTIGDAIKEFYRRGEAGMIKNAFDLPEKLIDIKDPILSNIASARKIYQECSSNSDELSGE
jgi:hypothetical protein